VPTPKTHLTAQRATFANPTLLAGILKNRPADRFMRSQLGPALVTERQVGGNDQIERLGQGARRVSGQDRVGQMVRNGMHRWELHFISWRNRSSANLMRDLIVPRGNPVSVAISLCDRSPK